MSPFFLLESLPPERLFALDEQTLVGIIIVLVNVAVLAFVLSKLLYKPVLQILFDRRARILGDIQAADKDKKDAHELKEKYELIMKDVEQEKHDILDAARKLAAENSEAQLAEARNEADATKTRAFREIELEQERTKSEMKQAVIDISSVMVSKFLSRNISADEHEKLFKETMAELEEIAWHN